jgi:AcrR family transcriptional regulator
MTSTATVVESATGRSDARRNRALVLAAAQRAFAEQGTGVSLAEIARRAGVGAGTVYRHFPTKTDLLEAVMQQRLDRMTVQAMDCLDAPDVGEAFFRLCATVVISSPRSQAVCDMIATDDGWPRAVMRGAGERFHRALDAVLTEAQRQGAVRRDVAVADVTAVFVGCVAMQRVSGTSEGLCAAARITLDALRAHPVTKGDGRVADRDENRYEMVDANLQCSMCGSALKPTGTGRPARYCSAACRQKAHRRRQRAV